MPRRGWKGETTTGVDVAGKMIARIERRRRRNLFENRRLTAGCKTAMVCGAFFMASFSTVRGHRHYGFTGRSVWIRYVAGWTKSASAFECDSCQALHLPHMQNFDGRCQIDRWTTWCSFPPGGGEAVCLLALSADLSAINASSLTVKAFIDIQDDNLPKLVVCQSLSIGPGDHGAVRGSSAKAKSRSRW